MITKETFKKLVLALAKHGFVESRVIDSVEYKAYKVSELTLILSQFKDKWTPEGVSFALFGQDVFISPDGNISVSDADDTDADVFSLKDEELMAVVASFLKWRLSVIERLKV